MVKTCFYWMLPLACLLVMIVCFFVLEADNALVFLAFVGFQSLCIGVAYGLTNVLYPEKTTFVINVIRSEKDGKDTADAS